MVNQSIKVYARVKKGCEEKPTVPYDITTNKEDFEDLTFYLSSRCTLNNVSGFRFHKVFNVNSLQADIFDIIAKPVITSVMDGFNGTIFAYGQTGSGKTYTMTGSASNYDERGIIPRSIQYIFQYYENVSEKPTIYISYLEIYNEIGYDLLGTKQANSTRTIDVLPRVSLLEDKNGDAHIRNLNVFPVSTEQEAMRLLFLGDTNRKIAETASNEFSSRSHCIFTLYINLRDSSSSNLRSSKLHIVDLAGSERLSKTKTKGPRVREAKSINLSLHYLQHVILALSKSKRTHIPYRNSFLTHMLRDSLNGKSVTSMLATISAKNLNIEETISTCRFAQRVSMISTDPVINVLDPQREIAFLKLKIDDLEKRLSSSTPRGFIDSKCLSKKKMDDCAAKIKSFIGSNKGNINIEPDMAEVQYCFNLLKKEVENKKKECVDLEKSLVKRNSEITVLSEELNKKELEIANLKKIIDRIPENPAPLKPIVPMDSHKPINSLNSNPNKSNDLAIIPKPTTEYSKRPSSYEEKRLYEIFTSNPGVSETLNYYKRELEERLTVAKKCAKNIEVSQRKISNIKQRLDGLPVGTEKSQLLVELENQQTLYKATLDQLRLLQGETFRLQCDLKKAEGTSQTNGMSQSQFQEWKKDYCSTLFPPPAFDFKPYNKKPLPIGIYPLEGYHSKQVIQNRDNDQMFVNGPKSMKQMTNPLEGYNSNQVVQNRDNDQMFVSRPKSMKEVTNPLDGYHSNQVVQNRDKDQMFVNGPKSMKQVTNRLEGYHSNQVVQNRDNDQMFVNGPKSMKQVTNPLDGYHSNQVLQNRDNDQMFVNRPKSIKQVTNSLEGYHSNQVVQNRDNDQMFVNGPKSMKQVTNPLDGYHSNQVVQNRDKDQMFVNGPKSMKQVTNPLDGYHSNQVMENGANDQMFVNGPKSMKQVTNPLDGYHSNQVVQNRDKDQMFVNGPKSMKQVTNPLDGYHSNQVMENGANDQMFVNGPKSMKQVHFGPVINTNTRPEVTSYFTKQYPSDVPNILRSSKKDTDIPSLNESTENYYSNMYGASILQNINESILYDEPSRSHSTQDSRPAVGCKDVITYPITNISQVRPYYPCQKEDNLLLGTKSYILPEDLVATKESGCTFTSAENQKTGFYPKESVLSIKTPINMERSCGNVSKRTKSFTALALRPSPRSESKTTKCTTPLTLRPSPTSESETTKSTTPLTVGPFPRSGSETTKSTTPVTVSPSPKSESDTTKSTSPLSVSPSPRSKYSPKENKCKEKEKDDDKNTTLESYFLETDTTEFKEFMKNVTLTGLADIDKEIFDFYRSKFC